MKILDKAAKLEKALLDRLGRRTDIARHPLELYRAILDDIEGATEPGARGARIFPYNAITVLVPTADAHHRATAEAVFNEPPSFVERVRTLLRNAGCTDVGELVAAIKLVDGTAPDWAGREYDIEFRRQSPPRQPKRGAKDKASDEHELQLSVLAGVAAKSRYSFKVARINLGRLADVADRQQRIVRQNQVAFVDSDDEISQSVSRGHAHIRFDTHTGDAMIHDDGSTHGTRVVRAGRTINVPHGGSRGLKLREGDEVLLGQARVRVEFRTAKARHGSARRQSPSQ
jgi:hypothetical protein